MTSRRNAGRVVTALRRAAEIAIGVLALGWAAGLFEPEQSDSPADAVPVPDADVRPLADVMPVASYDLEAVLDPEAHVVSATGTLRWKNASSRPVTELYVHLYMNAFEHERTVFRRERVSGFRGDAPADGGHIRVSRFFVKELGRDVWPAEPHTPKDPDDATDIRVDLGQPVAPGSEITIELAFETKLPSVALRAGYAGSFHMVAQWFPKIAKLEDDGRFAHFPYERLSEFYADFADYRVMIDTPTSFTVGATGVELSTSTADGRTRRTFEQRGVHDFAFAAWDRFQERSRDVGGVRVRCLYPPGLEAAAGVEIDAAARGLAFFGEAYGSYPYETLTIVHPPDDAAEAGGMEYPTLITTGGSFWLAHVPVLALEHLTLHELAHQWFYGMVATNENAFPFLDEGLTTYATGEALRSSYGYTVTPLLPVQLEGIDHAIRLGLPQGTPVATRAGGFASGGEYGALVYARTATILRTIDRVWGGAAKRAVGAYARRERFRHPTPAALESAIRAEAGERAADFFRAAVHDRGWVDFEAISVSSDVKEGGGYRAQVLVRRRGTLELPVEVEVVDETGRRARGRWEGRGPFAKIAVTTEARAVSAVVDPDNAVLVDEDRSNDAVSTKPPSIAPRSLALATLLSGIALSLSGP